MQLLWETNWRKDTKVSSDKVVALKEEVDKIFHAIEKLQIVDPVPLQDCVHKYIDDSTHYTFLQSTSSEPLAPDTWKRLVEIEGVLL